MGFWGIARLLLFLILVLMLSMLLQEFYHLPYMELLGALGWVDIEHIRI